ncbi:MAG: trypsin-like peptidase domain-containing protein [Acidobacteriota bacterium]|nr:trypsin-like peptidase domain-containing protein [Blastocatellia bacterium]MDW8241054.1 trypsin-like peptidase domain-containing protein [Acidobacteriota bacterium]
MNKYCLMWLLGTLLSVAVGPSAWAQTARKSSFTPPADIASIVEQVNPAVVNIEIAGGPGSMQQGSGFIIDGRGLIVTNYHVIAEAIKSGRPISVSLPDGQVVPASVRGTDEPTDIALLEVEVKGDPLPTVKLGDSDQLRIGDWVLAIGSPWGFDHTVTLGIISAKGRQLPGSLFNDFLQTDAAINPGNSGGPLVNERGEVIGISSYAATIGTGLAFAIPINTLKDILPQLREKGRVTRGSFAVRVVDTTPYIRKRFNLPRDGGVLVTSVKIGSSAARARLRREDIITKVNGVAITSASQFYRFIASQKEGTEIEITIFRDGREYVVRGVIEAASPTKPESSS